MSAHGGLLHVDIQLSPAILLATVVDVLAARGLAVDVEVAVCVPRECEHDRPLRQCGETAR